MKEKKKFYIIIVWQERQKSEPIKNNVDFLLLFGREEKQ